MHRFKYIDALRGIAIIMVIMHHSHPYFSGIVNYHLSPVIDTVLQHGDKGVTLFFLMSAFTLCLSMDNKKETEHKPVRNYFIRRFFRIAPLYFFIIGLILLLKVNSPSLSSILANVFFIHGISANWINSTVPGGWSVGIEVLFYLIFPVIFFKVKSTYSAVNLTLVSMIVAKIVTSIMFKHPQISDNLAWGNYVYENIISQLPVFLIGVCLFYIQKTKEEVNDQKQMYISYLYIAVLIIINLLGGNIFKEHYVFAIAFGFLALSLAKAPVKFFVNKFTIAIGKISYSLYLVHIIILSLLSKYHLTHYSENANIDLLIRFSIVFSLSIIFSIITYNLIEVPFQKYGKQLIKRLEFKVSPGYEN